MEGCCKAQHCFTVIKVGFDQSHACLDRSFSPGHIWFASSTTRWPVIVVMNGNTWDNLRTLIVLQELLSCLGLREIVQRSLGI